MRLLNLGCGATRLASEPEREVEWVNVDHFASMFEPSSPEWQQIAACPNYVDADITKRWPFDDGYFDGLIASHVLEHFDAREGLALLVEAYRVLKPGGIVLVSVPDASYFRKVYPEDRNENWPRLFETTDPKNTIPTFFEAALWFNEHKAILTQDAVWCYLKRSGFAPCTVSEYIDGAHDAVVDALTKQLNRRIFSVETVGVK